MTRDMAMKVDPAKVLARRRLLPTAYRLLPIRLVGPFFVLFLLALWEALSRLRLINVVLFPPVATIIGRFLALWADGTFLDNLLPTLGRMALGYGLAAALGISLGAIMGFWRGVHDRLQPLPPVAMIPVLILFLGIGEEMKVAGVAFGSIWPILLNTVDGVRGVHPTTIEVARVHQFTTPRTLRAVVLPAALPQIMAGLRTALPIALIVALVSEMVATTRGLGFFIVQNQRSFRMADMYAGIFLLAVVGYALNRGFLFLESRLMARHPARLRRVERSRG